jgi:hypothetical protein
MVDVLIEADVLGRQRTPPQAKVVHVHQPITDRRVLKRRTLWHWRGILHSVRKLPERLRALGGTATQISGHPYRDRHGEQDETETEKPIVAAVRRHGHSRTQGALVARLSRELGLLALAHATSRRTVGRRGRDLFQQWRVSTTLARKPRLDFSSEPSALGRGSTRRPRPAARRDELNIGGDCRHVLGRWRRRGRTGGRRPQQSRRQYTRPAQSLRISSCVAASGSHRARW